MGKPAWIAVLKSSISIRLFAILFLSILGLFFIYTSICNHYRDTMTLELVRTEAFRASSFIKKSLDVEMMEKERDHIHRTVRHLGAEPGMEAIRIYNDRGEIRFSSESDEIGTSVALDSDACRSCHASEGSPTVLPSGQLPLRTVALLTRATLPAVALMAIVPIASGVGSGVVPPEPAACCIR